MNKKISWFILSFLMVLSLVLASCGGEEEEEDEEEEVVIPTEEEVVTPTEEEVVTLEGEGNWWDKWGEPEYGGRITLRATSDVASFDYWRGGDRLGVTGFVYEQLAFASDWTLDRKIFSYETMYTHDKYWVPGLAESWEMTSPYQQVFHIRKGVYFHDKAPVNGRELTADDIGYTCARLMGIGYGFTEGSPYVAIGQYSYFENVYSTDKYTLVIEFNQARFDFQDTFPRMAYPPEIIEQYGSYEDWKNMIGTGPWIMQDYVVASSGTVVRNPNYWGYDERYPENKLPYADGIKVLIIPDNSTAYAALRTGKIDVISNVDWEQGQSLLETYPELQYKASQGMSYAKGLRPRVDVKPFDDIRVRKAINMAIDRKTIAETYYGGFVDPGPFGIISPLLPDFNTPYTEWPEEVQEGYTYTPEGAKALLAEAGYSNGFNTSVHISTAEDLDLCQIFKGMLSEVGIDMEIKVVESTVFSSYVNTNRKHDQMAWDSCTHWSSSPMRGFQLFYSKSYRDNQNIQDPVLDAIYERSIWKEGEASITMDEANERLIAQIKEMDMRIISQFWLVPSVPGFSYTLWQPWFKGYSGEPGRCALNYMGCWVDEELKSTIGR
jgi:peptide/nickel transport system substrate-binding protein